MFGLVLSLSYVGAFVTEFLGSSSLFIAVFPSFAVVSLLAALAGKVKLSLVYAYAGYFGWSFLLDLFGVQLKKSNLCPEHTWKKTPRSGYSSWRSSWSLLLRNTKWVKTSKSEA